MTEDEIESIIGRSRAGQDVPADEVKRLGERALAANRAVREAKAALVSGDAATALLLLSRALA